MGPTIEWSILTASTNMGLEELPLRAGALETLHRRGVHIAVVVVGRLQLNDHVPLGPVVADARNVTAVFDFRTREGIE